MHFDVYQEEKEEISILILIFNSFMTEVPIIQKPDNGLTLQINGFYMIAPLHKTLTTLISQV